MRNAFQLVQEVADAGGRFVMSGDGLKVAAPAPLPDTFMAELRDHKAEIIDFLKNETPVTDPELKPLDGTDFEERAAMVEYEAGVPRDWADGFARLCTLPRHPDYTETRWQGLIDDAGLFLDQWAAKVDGLGWSTQEVFGVHHAKPSTRIDLQGLVPCIRGRKVVAVTANSATIETITGARQRIFRRTDAQSPGRVAVWEIDPKDENACPPRQ